MARFGKMRLLAFFLILIFSIDSCNSQKMPVHCTSDCDGKLCRTVEGTFDFDNLHAGYNDIILIPASATNIEVSELVPTRNYLAIRSMGGDYFLNGNWRIEFPRELFFAGTSFRYDRRPHAHSDPEVIRSPGPTSEALIVALLYQEHNQGIKYRYSMPVTEKNLSDSFDPRFPGDREQLEKEGQATATGVKEEDRKSPSNSSMLVMVEGSGNDDVMVNSTEYGPMSDSILLEGSGYPEPISNCSESDASCGIPCDPLVEVGCPETGKANCSVSPFGCCPDGVTASSGHNFKGCGCGTSPHGCCPDEKTPATGPDHAGCTCKESQFGCCPDGKSPASGPKNQGCTCEQMAFGCCPDRVTTATGPNNTGCPCDTLPFGCCPNSSNHATGPMFAGCFCLESPHGCCGDGVSVAYGPNFEGCADGPPLDTMLAAEACSLPKERGSCRNYTVKWYFDMKYGGCTRFWYGGCEGNANRFNSQEECERICVQPEGTESCSLPKVEGPCEGSYPSWFYSKSLAKCEPFKYGGCLGNKNRYDTRESCEEHCATVAVSAADTCEQPVQIGPCRGAYERWFFSKSDGRCRTFIYGGCRGNSNNFDSEKSCLDQCQTLSQREICLLPKAEGPCLGQYPRWFYDYVDSSCKEFTFTGCQGNKNRFVDKNTCEKACNTTRVEIPTDICSLPKKEGPCNGAQLRWSFSREKGRCEQFYYGGCEGNANKFESRADCERACIPVTREQKVCLLQKEVGNCLSQYYQFQERWYYDAHDKKCHRFYFSGCGGNGNNFEKFDECQQLCGRLEPEVKPDQAVLEFKIEDCSLEQDHGPCFNNEIKWSYDKRDGVCKEFYYGGCGGNFNRFGSRKECELKCWNSQDICRLPQVRGPCTGNFIQWYHEPTFGECVEYSYGGCAGNANRFSSKETCDAQCKSGGYGSAPVTTAVAPGHGSNGQGASGGVRSREAACLQVADAGTCKAYLPQFFYDQSDNMCKSFVYGGCGGNSNRFESRRECEARCVTSRDRGSEDSALPEIERDEVCRLTVEAGPCSETHARWFYDPSSFQCLPFVYGGCGGNKNRFKTSEVCLKYCQGVSNYRPEFARRPEDDGRGPDPDLIIPPVISREDEPREPYVPPPAVFVTPAPSTRPPPTASTVATPVKIEDMYGTGCDDSPFFPDCTRVIQNRYCSNDHYAKYCCKSCFMSGQLTREKVLQIILINHHDKYHAGFKKRRHHDSRHNSHNRHNQHPHPDQNNSF